MAVRNGFDYYFSEKKKSCEIANKEEIVTEAVAALRHRKIGQSLFGGTARYSRLLEQPLESKEVCDMFRLKVQENSSVKSHALQLVEKFMIFASSLPSEEIKQTLEIRSSRIENLFHTGGTFKSFLDLFFMDFSKTMSMAKLLKSNSNKCQTNHKGEQDSKAGAAEKNAEQIKRLSSHGTVWHAVSAFAKDQGKASSARTRAPARARELKS
jgi:hypothetical protein